MNTDNMSVVCETIDYGPCAYMDHYSHQQVFSSIDHHGRYAYNNQPNIGLWNLSRFAECLLPLIDAHTEMAVDIAKQHLESFVSHYQRHWLSGMRAKLGLNTAHDKDKALIDMLLDIMDSKHIDFTLTFYHLSQLDSDSSNDDAILALFDHAESIKHWLEKWRQRLQQEASDDDVRKTSMGTVNPFYIPRNHLIEAAIRAAEDEGDLSVFYALHDVLQRPYEVQPGKEAYTQPPQPHEVVEKTFCGT